VFGFYTMYLTSTVSLSVLGGPQHYFSRDPVSGASAGSWTPSVQGSLGYQKTRTSLAASFSHTVSNAGGLVGAFHSNIGEFEAHRQLTPRWGVNANGSYALFKNVTPNVSAFNPGGHTLTGEASATRNFHEHLLLEFGYARFHQSYGNLGPAVQLFPDSNRVFGSVQYMFSRPIGR
jgi:hypothetical protein